MPINYCMFHNSGVFWLLFLPFVISMDDRSESVHYRTFNDDDNDAKDASGHSRHHRPTICRTDTAHPATMTTRVNNRIITLTIDKTTCRGARP
jgi:hypothetical protein